jgi:hypothetical protein
VIAAVIVASMAVAAVIVSEDAAIRSSDVRAAADAAALDFEGGRWGG